MRTTWLASCSCAPACSNSFQTTRTARVGADGRLTAGRCAGCADARRNRISAPRMARLAAQIAAGYGTTEALGAAQGEPCGCGGYAAAEMERIVSAIYTA